MRPCLRSWIVLDKVHVASRGEKLIVLIHKQAERLIDTLCLCHPAYGVTATRCGEDEPREEQHLQPTRISQLHTRSKVYAARKHCQSNHTLVLLCVTFQKKLAQQSHFDEINPQADHMLLLSASTA